MIFYYSRHQACKYKKYAQMLPAPTQHSNILKVFYNIRSNKKTHPQSLSYPFQPWNKYLKQHIWYWPFPSKDKLVKDQQNFL